MGPEGARPRAGAGLSRASAYLQLGTWRLCRGCVGGKTAFEPLPTPTQEDRGLKQAKLLVRFRALLALAQCLLPCQFTCSTLVSVDPLILPVLRIPGVSCSST